MCKTQWMLGLLALYAHLGHSWDIAVSHGNLLEFYTNQTKSDTIRFGSQKPAALAYDGVHDILLYVDKQSGNDSICGYFIEDNKFYCYIERKYRNIRGLAYDPVTELVFFSDIDTRSIYRISLNSGSKNNVDGTLLIKMEDQGIPTDIAVDSCKGYVYWINTNLPTPTIERARFDGSERKVIINTNSKYVNSANTLDPHSLTIDQRTRKIYWIEPATIVSYRVYYADLNGNNRFNLMSFIFEGTYTNPPSNALTVSEKALFWVDWRSETDNQILVRKYGKLQHERFPNPIDLNTTSVTVGLAANYEISLASYLRYNCGEPFCVHGTKVSGQLYCKCTLGYIGERCDVSVCENYCFRGDCTFNDDGQPKCRCHKGFSGERCEVAACL